MVASQGFQQFRFLLPLLLIINFAPGCTRNPSRQQREITVAAAADLSSAFVDLRNEFENQTKVKVIFSFGSSGLLAKQIENGAPMDLFAAANVDYIDDLERKGLIISDTKAVYARGRITLWVPKDSPISIKTISDLAKPEVKRLAIANPDHAPYGLAARQALETAGIWPEVKPKVVYGDNIRQTLQYAQTGNVEAAIVALSLSLQSDGRWILVPENLHAPIDQALAVIQGTKNESDARRFAGFVDSAFGRAVMKKYGFVLPGEKPSK
ncbi:MAG TPA: molybdate ABC transporter substrate-binding protein [Pyrinomonadaceae bacterium]|nr:molybdate ABC transporter substrate-binding protein [Pyrinomonadaceae bacterium]